MLVLFLYLFKAASSETFCRFVVDTEEIEQQLNSVEINSDTNPNPNAAAPSSIPNSADATPEVTILGATALANSLSTSADSTQAPLILRGENLCQTDVELNDALVNQGHAFGNQIHIPVTHGMLDLSRWIDDTVEQYQSVLVCGRPVRANVLAKYILVLAHQEFPGTKQMPSFEQIKRKIYNVRKKEHGDVVDMIAKLELPVYKFCHGDNKLEFFKGSFSLAMKPEEVTKDYDMHRVIVMGHPKFKKLFLQRGFSLFVDATFKVCPKKPCFYQLLIFMAYDSPSQVYVPCYYALMTGKMQWLYKTAFEMILRDVDANWEKNVVSGYVSCDWEQALLNAVIEFFCSKNDITRLKACVFHMYKAFRTKMEKLGFDRATINALTMNGVLDVLRVCTRDQVDDAVEFLKEKFDCNNRNNKFYDKWQELWRYFTKYWLNKFEFYNLSEITQKDLYNFVNATNNPLERYNKELGKRVDHGATLLQFYTQVKCEPEEYLRILSLIDNGDMQKPKRSGANIPKVPQAFLDYLDLKKKKNEQRSNQNSNNNNNNIIFHQKKRRVIDDSSEGSTIAT